MRFLPVCYFPHIKIEEVSSLTEDEASMLLYICNVWAPIKLPQCKEEHPITLNLIRCAQRSAIIDRVIQAHSVISEEGKEIYNSLRTKLNIPNPSPTPIPITEQSKEKTKESEKEILNGPTTGSNV